MATVTKLIRSVESQPLRSKLVRSVVEGLDERIAELFAAENYDDVARVMRGESMYSPYSELTGCGSARMRPPTSFFRSSCSTARPPG